MLGILDLHSLINKQNSLREKELELKVREKTHAQITVNDARSYRQHLTLEEKSGRP
jgi:hypothetical protein